MTTIVEKLAYCKICKNRKVDFEKGGLICSLTDEQANFKNECEFFILDQERQAEVAANAQSYEQMDDKSDNGASDMLWDAV